MNDLEKQQLMSQAIAQQRDNFANEAALLRVELASAQADRASLQAELTAVRGQLEALQPKPAAVPEEIDHDDFPPLPGGA